MKSLLALVLALSLVGTTSAFEALSKTRLATLLVQLGSADFEERESATRDLKELGERAYHPLRETMLATKDAEVRARIDKLIETMQPGHKLPVKLDEPGAILAVDFFPDGKRAVFSQGGMLRIWDLPKQRELHRIKAHSFPLINHARVSPDGKMIVSTGEAGVATLTDTKTAKVRSRPLRLSLGLRMAAFSPDGKLFVAGGHTGIYIVEVSTGKVLHSIRPPGKRTGIAATLNSVAFGPKGKRFLAGNGYGLTTLWDTKTGKLKREFRFESGGHGPVNSIAFTPDGNAFVNGGYSDNLVRLWDIETGKVIRKFDGHRNTVFCVAISPDGKQLVTGGDHSKVCVWDLATGRLVYTFQGHNRPVSDVSISPDGKWALSVGGDVWHWRLP